MKRINEIEARANAATEGPWMAEADPDEFPAVLGPVQVGRNVVTQSWIAPDVNEQSDAEFISHARQDVPALVAALRAVLGLHASTPSDIYPNDVCHHPHCTDPTDQMEQSPWPCPTVTAIRQHLGEDA